MRIYIIGNDGITLCREPTTTVNEGEIVVASNEELHAARLSGRRLLALWNALPGVDKRRKLGDRDALILSKLWMITEQLGPRVATTSPKPTRRRLRPKMRCEIGSLIAKWIESTHQNC